VSNSDFERLQFIVLELRKYINSKDFNKNIENLKMLRNKMYAHNDVSYNFDYEMLINDYNLKIEDLNHMTDIVGVICISILSLLVTNLEYINWSDDLFEKYTSDISIVVTC